MAEVSGITQEMRELLSVDTEPIICEVEKGMIKKFAQAIDDNNPLWQDEEHAKKTGYGGIIAPPTFPTALSTGALFERFLLLESPFKRLLNGGNELEYFQPIKPGDVISVTAKIADLRERETKAGKMLFMVIEITYKNQRGEVAARERDTIIRY